MGCCGKFYWLGQKNLGDEVQIGSIPKESGNFRTTSPKRVGFDTQWTPHVLNRRHRSCRRSSRRTILTWSRTSTGEFQGSKDMGACEIWHLVIHCVDFGWFWVVFKYQHVLKGIDKWQQLHSAMFQECGWSSRRRAQVECNCSNFFNKVLIFSGSIPTWWPTWWPHQERHGRMNPADLQREAHARARHTWTSWDLVDLLLILVGTSWAILKGPFLSIFGFHVTCWKYTKKKPDISENIRNQTKSISIFSHSGRTSLLMVKCGHLLSSRGRKKIRALLGRNSHQSPCKLIYDDRLCHAQLLIWSNHGSGFHYCDLFNSDWALSVYV